MTFSATFIGSTLRSLKKVSYGRNGNCQNFKKRKFINTWLAVVFNNEFVKRFDSLSVLLNLNFIKIYSGNTPKWTKIDNYSSKVTDTGSQSLYKFTSISSWDFDFYGVLYFLNSYTEIVENLNQLTELFIIKNNKILNKERLDKILYKHAKLKSKLPQLIIDQAFYFYPNFMPFWFKTRSIKKSITNSRFWVKYLLPYAMFQIDLWNIACWSGSCKHYKNYWMAKNPNRWGFKFADYPGDLFTVFPFIENSKNAYEFALNEKMFHLKERRDKIKYLIATDIKNYLFKLKSFSNIINFQNSYPSLNYVSILVSSAYERDETFLNTEGFTRRSARIISTLEEKHYGWEMTRIMLSPFCSSNLFFDKYSNKLLYFDYKLKSVLKNYMNFNYQASISIWELNSYLNYRTKLYIFKKKRFIWFFNLVWKQAFAKSFYWLEDYYGGSKDDYSRQSLILSECGTILKERYSNFF